MAGFIVIGSGFAILISGRLIPWLNRLAPADGWRLGWLTLGVTVLLIAVFCLIVFRNSPDELGLRPVGADDLPAEIPVQDPAAPLNKKGIYHLGAIYFLFGYTYVIYATFLVSALVHERGFTEAAAGSLWSWIGLLSLLSGPVFGGLSDILGRKIVLLTVFLIQMLAYLFLAFRLPAIFLYASIGCFGMVAWSIPSIMAALVGDYAGAGRAARVFGFITFIFALGQIAGPAVAGFVAERTGSFGNAFLMAAGLAGLAAILSALLEKPAAT